MTPAALERALMPLAPRAGSLVLSLYRGLLRVPPDVRPGRHEIAQQVADRHRLPLAVLKGISRAREVVRARQEAMWLMRRHGYNNGEVARALNRTTWTVEHGIRRHASRLSGSAS